MDLKKGSFFLSEKNKKERIINRVNSFKVQYHTFFFSTSFEMLRLHPPFTNFSHIFFRYTPPFFVQTLGFFEMDICRQSPLSKYTKTFFCQSVKENENLWTFTYYQLLFCFKGYLYKCCVLTKQLCSVSKKVTKKKEVRT